MKTTYFYLFLLISICLKTEIYAQTLDDYLQLAGENNPGLEATYYEFEAALQKIPQVGSLADPTLSFGYFILPTETRVGAQRARFSLTQMFPWFGTLAAQKDAAALMSEAKYQAFLDARNELFYKVNAAYYPLYELNEIIRLHQENLEILNTFKTLSTSSFRNGKGSMTDVLRVDLMMNDIETEIAILRIKQKPLAATFNKLLNREANETVVITDSLEISAIESGYRLDSLLVANPKLAALQSQIKASEAQEKAARKQGLPKIGVGLDYVMVDKRTDMEVPDNGKDILMPMVSVSLPIYRKKYTAARDEARLMQNAYGEMQEEVSNNLESAYETAWFELERSREMVALLDSQIVQTNQTIDLLMKSYSNSGKEFEEVLRMQQQLLKYKMMRATAIKEFYVAVARLDYLTAKQLID